MLHGYGDYLSDEKNIIKTFNKRFQWMERHIPPGQRRKLLDVGCATGFAVEHASQRGWDAYGLETSRYAVEVARKRLGERIKAGTLDDRLWPASSFQMVLLWDVIEHLPHPQKALEEIYALLEPGGWLSIITPDCGSPLAQMMGRFWMEYAKPTEHIYFYSKNVLRKALKQNGFEIGAVSTAGKHLGLDFFLNRLGFLFPPVRSWGSNFARSRFSKLSVYVNPGDKLFLLAQKPR
jgi:2-polyprenyl-3-methyl-5-hydroxy-6-metoxy-1,4-benzoquinol methylase